MALFSREIPEEFLDFLKNRTYEAPESYQKVWEPSSFWDEFKEVVDKHNLKTLSGEFEGR